MHFCFRGQEWAHFVVIAESSRRNVITNFTKVTKRYIDICFVSLQLCFITEEFEQIGRSHDVSET